MAQAPNRLGGDVTPGQLRNWITEPPDFAPRQLAGLQLAVTRTLEKGSGWRFAATKPPVSRRQVRILTWMVRLLADLRASWPSSVENFSTDQIFHRARGGKSTANYLACQLRRITGRCRTAQDASLRSAALCCASPK